MRIKVQKGSIAEHDPVTVGNVTYVICYDDNKRPLAIIEQVGRDVIQFTKANEPTFERILARLDNND